MLCELAAYEMMTERKTYTIGVTQARGAYTQVLSASAKIFIYLSI